MGLFSSLPGQTWAGWIFMLLLGVAVTKGEGRRKANMLLLAWGQRPRGGNFSLTNGPKREMDGGMKEIKMSSISLWCLLCNFNICKILQGVLHMISWWCNQGYLELKVQHFANKTYNELETLRLKEQAGIVQRNVCNGKCSIQCFSSLIHRTD